MKPDNFEVLILRELCGEITPEEEAWLMDAVNRDPKLAELYRSERHLSREIQASLKTPPPPELAARVANHVLQGQIRPAWHTSTASLLKRAATLLLILSLGGTLGYLMGRGREVVHATSSPTTASELWQRILGLDAAQFASWEEIGREGAGARDRAPAAQMAKIDEQTLARRLKLLRPKQREIFLHHTGLPRFEMERLLRAARGR